MLSIIIFILLASRDNIDNQKGWAIILRVWLGCVYNDDSRIELNLAEAARSLSLENQHLLQDFRKCNTILPVFRWLLFPRIRILFFLHLHLHRFGSVRPDRDLILEQVFAGRKKWVQHEDDGDPARELSVESAGNEFYLQVFRCNAK